MDFTGNCSLCLIWLRIQVETDHILLGTVIDPGIHEDQFKELEADATTAPISLSMTIDNCSITARDAAVY